MQEISVKNSLILRAQKTNTMITIYHNPRCKKSRAGLEHLKTKTQDIEVIDYIKNPISYETIKDLLMKLNKKPQEMIRTQEAVFKQNFKGKNFGDEEWIKIMEENPKLIKRPIIVRENKAIWGDPTDEIDSLF